MSPHDVLSGNQSMRDQEVDGHSQRDIDRNRITVTKIMELTSNEAVKQALLAGLGYSIMPLIGIRSEYKKKELQIIPMKGLPITTTWSLIWLKGKRLSPVSVAYLEHLRKSKERIVSEKFSWYEVYGR